MHYKISEAANQDLEAIWLYTFENWSLEQADRYFNLIVDAIELLAKNPESGTDYGNIRKGYFRARIKAHFIFYKLNKKEGAIEIIRILHQKMDIESRLGE